MTATIQLTTAVKEAFFDRPKVQRALRKANRSALGKAAAFVRRVARNSLRKPPRASSKQQRDKLGRFLKSVPRTASAPAGKPPYRRSDPGLQTIIYAFSGTSGDSAIVGPILLNGTKRISTKTGPELQEFGGTAMIEVPRKGTSTLHRRREKKRVTVAPHPFMRPALLKSKDRFPDLWRGSVTG